MRRRVLAVVIACAATIGVASATSLGSFASPTLSAEAGVVDHCEATADVLDSSLASIPLITLLSAFTIEYAAFTGIDAACDAQVPVVVLLGFEPLGSTIVVLGQVPVAPLDESAGASQQIPVTSTTIPLGSLVTEIRVAYTDS